MKDLEDHLQLVSQMVEEENSNFQSFLETLKKKSEWLDQYPCCLLWTERGQPREEEKTA
jgi:hypothetical protein